LPLGLTLKNTKKQIIPPNGDGHFACASWPIDYRVLDIRVLHLLIQKYEQLVFFFDSVI
jgi:hypothetical protein